MTTNQTISRSDEIRKRKTQSSPSDQTRKTRKSSHQVYQATSTSSRKSNSSSMMRHGVYQPGKLSERSKRQSNTRDKSATITIPTAGPRLISAILAVLMGILLIVIWNSNTFVVTGAEFSGISRLNESDLNSVFPYAGQTIFNIIPKDVENSLISHFPDIENIKVRIGFPNRIFAAITERTPVLLWVNQDGSQSWIDANGYSFPVDGEVEGLIAVTSFGNPLVPEVSAPEGSDTENVSSTITPFIQSTLLTNIIELNKLAPEGASISYNPKYGLGWKDPHGWRVYFGENTLNVALKMDIYQAIIDKLTQLGIQPTMISVEYLDAPFYRTD